MTGREIVVYSKDKCQQCTATVRWLDAHPEVKYVTVDATTEENIAYVKELGYTQAPVTVVKMFGEVANHWYGFNPEELNKLILAAAA